MSSLVCTKKLAPGYSKSLLISIADLWMTSVLTDIVVVVCERRFPAHKCILAAASPFFKAMFSSGMEEQDQKEIFLHEVDPNIFQSILSFMYSGSLSVDENTCQDLLAVADMLGIEEVMGICSEFLLANITAQNCLGIYAFAEAHCMPALKRQSELFMEKHFVEASCGEEFCLLDADVVLPILESERLHIEHESQVLDAAIRWVTHDLPSRRKLLLRVLNKVRINLVSHRHLFEIIDSCKDHEIKLCLTKFASPSETLKSINSHSQFMDVASPNQFTEPRENAKKYIYVVGGFCRCRHSFVSTIKTLDIVERFDVYTKTWQSFCSMSNPRSSHGFSVLDRRIVVAGGEDASLISDTVESFDPDENVWTALPNMTSPRYGLALVSVKDSLFAIGGYVGTQIGGNVEKYDSVSKTWNEFDGMPNPRFSFSAIEYEGLIYVAGGLSELYMESDVFESYNPVTKEWNKLASLKVARAYHCLVASEGFLYAVGGFNEYQGSLKSVERYSIEQGKWESVAPLSTSRAGAGVAVFNKKIYVFGGRSQDVELYGTSSFCASLTLKSGECYDPTTALWTDLPDMEHERCEMAAVVM